MGYWYNEDGKRYVYCLTSKKTGKKYIGSSKNPLSRYKTHISELKRGSHKVKEMQNDFDELHDDYDFEVLETLDSHTDYDKISEYFWMVWFQTDKKGIGYNNNDKANLYLEEARKKLSDRGIDYAVHEVSCTNDDIIKEGVNISLLKRKIKERGYRADEFYKSIGVRKGDYYSKLREPHRITANFIRKVCKELSLSKNEMSEIFFVDEEKTEYQIMLDRLKSYLRKNKISRKKAADKLGITEYSFSRKLSGDIKIGSVDIYKISEALGMTNEESVYVFFGET